MDATTMTTLFLDVSMFSMAVYTLYVLAHKDDVVLTMMHAADRVKHTFGAKLSCGVMLTMVLLWASLVSAAMDNHLVTLLCFILALESVYTVIDKYSDVHVVKYTKAYKYRQTANALVVCTLVGVHIGHVFK